MRQQEPKADVKLKSIMQGPPAMGGTAVRQEVGRESERVRGPASRRNLRRAKSREGCSCGSRDGSGTAGGAKRSQGIVEAGHGAASRKSCMQEGPRDPGHVRVLQVRSQRVNWIPKSAHHKPLLGAASRRLQGPKPHTHTHTHTRTNTHTHEHSWPPALAQETHCLHESCLS